MKKLLIAAMLLLVPQLAAARVYMCVDQATGKTSFTDKACESVGSREEVKVHGERKDSGQAPDDTPQHQTWNSQADNRKTGLDYNSQRRSLYFSKATASTE